MNLYKSNEIYTVEILKDHSTWLEKRKEGIGGSDAAAFLGCGFKTLRQIWRQKKGLEEDSFKGNEATTYGTTVEPALRTLYQAKHLDQDIQYLPDVTLVSNAVPWRRYSPDGLIWEPETGRRGILEIKTYRYRNKDTYLEDWGNDWDPALWKVPLGYYFQVLHGLLVTGFDFVTFTAEIKYGNESKLIERTFDRDECWEHIEDLAKIEEEKYIKYFEGNEEPPIELTI